MCKDLWNLRHILEKVATLNLKSCYLTRGSCGINLSCGDSRGLSNQHIWRLLHQNKPQNMPSLKTAIFHHLTSFFWLFLTSNQSILTGKRYKSRNFLKVAKSHGESNKSRGIQKSRRREKVAIFVAKSLSRLSEVLNYMCQEILNSICVRHVYKEVLDSINK